MTDQPSGAPLNREEILVLLKEKKLVIEPIDEQSFSQYAYRLKPSEVRFTYRGQQGQVKTEILSLKDSPFELEALAHCVVALQERILLNPGFVGQLFPSSHCIEKGLILTVGRIEPGYDKALVLGVFNASRIPTTLSNETEIARISICRATTLSTPLQQHPGAYIENVDTMRAFAQE